VPLPEEPAEAPPGSDSHDDAPVEAAPAGTAPRGRRRDR
jgi:hypothetical protein